MSDKDKDRTAENKAAANIRLAVFLGLITLGVYAGFIFYYFK